MMLAASSPHPPSQPRAGPKAWLTQVKVVPESGVSALSSR